MPIYWHWNWCSFNALNQEFCLFTQPYQQVMKYLQAKEVINAVTGKTEVGKPSRLCKQNMFRRWTQLVPQLSALPQTPASTLPSAPCATDESLSSIGYDLAKSKALLYQVIMQILTRISMVQQLEMFLHICKKVLL